MKLAGLKVIANLLPNIKRWVFSDGKFNPQRALIMLAFFVAILAGGYFFGFDEVMIAVGILDDVSDAIGYED